MHLLHGEIADVRSLGPYQEASRLVGSGGKHHLRIRVPLYRRGTRRAGGSTGLPYGFPRLPGDQQRVVRVERDVEHLDHRPRRPAVALLDVVQVPATGVGGDSQLAVREPSLGPAARQLGRERRPLIAIHGHLRCTAVSLGTARCCQSLTCSTATRRAGDATATCVMHIDASGRHRRTGSESPDFDEGTRCPHCRRIPQLHSHAMVGPGKR